MFNKLKFILHFVNLKSAIFLRGNNPIFCNRIWNSSKYTGHFYPPVLLARSRLGGQNPCQWNYHYLRFLRQNCLRLFRLGSQTYCKRWDKAQATVEYAIVLIILVIACIGVIALFSGALGAMFNKLANTRAGLLGVGP